MRVSGSLSVLTMRVLSLAITRAGGDADGILRDAGVDVRVLADPEARVPRDVAFAAFELAMKEVSDPTFCLTAAEAVPLGAMATLDFAVRSSQTLGEAMQRVARYYRLVDDESVLHVEHIGATAMLWAEPRAMPPPRAATELLFSMIVTRGRGYTGEPWPLREVRFVGPAPRGAHGQDGHARFFGAKVRFLAPRNELVFDASFLDVPCRAADPALSTFLDTEVEARLQKIAKPEPFLVEVRRAVSQAMHGSEPTLASTAKRLATSERTLQRRLS